MIRFIGAKVIQYITDLGGFAIMFGKMVKGIFTPPFPFKNFIEQMIKIGWNSFPVVFFTAVATGAILALQSGYAMSASMKGSEQFVGGVVALSITRELGPVLCAIMIGARAGSGITAEIGTMKVTEQIDALTTLSANPIHYLVVPRVLAGIIMVPVLTMFTDLIAIVGGMVVSVYELGISEQQYWDVSLRFLTMNDVINGLIKSFFFGLIITMIACFEGFKTEGGAEGVGKSTTRAVVSICMTILGCDYLLSSLLTTSF